jgi:cobalt-precorrin-5B (C1)-methyltransferase
MRAYYQLPDIALIEMGDFAGAVLKHLKRAPVDKLSMCGGFGKLSKLAAGHLDLHSRHSSIDLPLLAAWAEEHATSDSALQAAIMGANTSQEALAMALKKGVPLGDIVCERARDVARAIVPESVEVEMFAIDRQGNIVGAAR